MTASSRLTLAAATLAVGLAFAAQAQAQTVTVTVIPASNAPELGRVVVIGGATSFAIDASTGSVTRLSGDAVRLDSAGTTSPTVSITCTGSLLCTTSPLQITVTAVATSGPATFTQFSVANLANTTFFGGAPTPGSSLSFSVNAIANRTATFSLGTRVTVSGTAAAGAYSFSYLVSASLL